MKRPFVNGNRAFIDTSALLRLLVNDDETKSRAVEKLIKESQRRGLTLYLPPIVILEIVWVLEKVYKYKRNKIREIVEAILNTPELKCLDENIFRNAIEIYEERNIKFADAVIGSWGLSHDLSIVYTFDEKDFRKITGLDVKKP